MDIFATAWRNVWRNARRSVVTMAAMAFALWVMVLYSGLVEGYLDGMAGDVLDYEVGVQVFADGYRDDPSLYTRVGPEVVDELEAAGFAVSPRLLAGGLVAAGEASAGMRLVGIDIERDGAVLRVSERVARGEWLDPADPKGAVLGFRLARVLGADPGDELLVLSQAADGSMANDLFTVRGVLGGVGDGTDRTGLFLTRDEFGTLMGVPADEAHQLIVRTDGDLDAAAAQIEELAPGIEARTWRKLMPIVAQMLDSTRGLIYIVLASWRS